MKAIAPCASVFDNLMYNNLCIVYLDMSAGGEYDDSPS